MSIQHENRLDQELNALLQHLGVQQERQDTQSQEEVHITCLYSDMDRSLWKEVQKHLALLKHPTGGVLHWRAHDVASTSRLPAWQMKRIQEDLGQAHLVVLFISIDLLVALSGKAAEVYQAVIATFRREQQPAKGLVVPARPAAWYDDDLIDLPRAPREGTLATMPHAELGYVEVAHAVQQAINDLLHTTREEEHTNGNQRF